MPGTGIGYTGIRIRGSDPSESMFQSMEYPLNDAESQSVFWVDFRISSPQPKAYKFSGELVLPLMDAGAFGGSINLNTSVLHVKPYARFESSLGSFGTQKASVQLGSGMLNNRWSLDGRLSKIHSDGYIDRAEANLTSFFGSAAYYGTYSTLRLNVFTGSEVTYQAWNGVPAQYIEDPDLRTFNTAGTEKADAPHDNEVDDYDQQHYQLLYDTRLNLFARVHAGLHYTKGNGFFEQYKADQSLADYLIEGNSETDLIRRRWLDNDFFGGIFNLNMEGHSEGPSIGFGDGLSQISWQTFWRSDLDCREHRLQWDSQLLR